VGPIQRSVGRCRGKERIWLLNYRPSCSPYVTQHCHHQVEIFVNWLTVASAACGLASEPGSHRCEEGELQFRLLLRVSTRHQTSCTFSASKCNDKTELQMPLQIYRSHLWSTDTALHTYKYHTAILQINMLADRRYLRAYIAVQIHRYSAHRCESTNIVLNICRFKHCTCDLANSTQQVACTLLRNYDHHTTYLQKWWLWSTDVSTADLQMPHYDERIHYRYQIKFICWVSSSCL
jgi:hypothetical protein